MQNIEELLTPSDWQMMENLGIEMVKDMMEFPSNVRERKFGGANFAGDIWFSDNGIELSRGFKAIKIWMP